MAKPNWRKSTLYQGILEGYKRNGTALSATQRRKLRENLLLACESRSNAYHRVWCLQLMSAFSWASSPQGSLYWSRIDRGLAPPPINR